MCLHVMGVGSWRLYRTVEYFKFRRNRFWLLGSKRCQEPCDYGGVRGRRNR